MANSLDGRMKRVEVKVRITDDLHTRLLEECNHCGCSVSGVVAIAIAREVSKRRAARIAEAHQDILIGQYDIEGKANA